MDGTIDGDRIDRALSILDGKDIQPVNGPSSSDLLARAGRILPCTKVAEMLGVTPQCLRNWRKKENGLKPFISPGSTRAAGYLEGDVLDYIDRIRGTSISCAS